MQLIFSLFALLLTFPLKDHQLPEVTVTRIPDHTLWTTELKKYVTNDGLVNYKAWKEDQDNLDDYLRKLSGPLPLSNWSQNVQLAYWINLYNAYTIKLVLQNYPLTSIMDLYNGKPQDEVWILLNEQKYSLGQIENEILFQFNDARIHFTLNHASKTSAPLLMEAYVPEQLNLQLHTQTERFINNKRYNVVKDTHTLLSPIFMTYTTDFKPDLRSYLKAYLDEPIADSVHLDFFDIDWALNEQIIR